MFYRRLGRTGLNVSAIGIGAGIFNVKKDPSITLEKSREAINLAVSKGANFIDMGKEYNESFISKALGNLKDDIILITRSESKNAEEMKRDIEDSIKKLKTNPDIYEVMVNSIDDFRSKVKNGVIEALKDAKLSGKIGFIGIFSHKIEVLKEAIKTNEFDVVMTLYNAVHRKAEEIFHLKEKYDFGLIAASPFATGILIDPKYDKNIHIPGSEFMSAENALKFVLSSRYIDATVVGMKNPTHIKENIKIVERKILLTEDERKKIVENMENFLGKNFCRMCRYCEGCQRVSIADLLKLLIIGNTYGYLNFVKYQRPFFKEKLFNKNFFECEKLCPYNVPISKLLKKLKDILE